MKTLIPILTIGAALTVLGPTVLRAQDSAQDSEDSTSAEEIHNARKAKAEAQKFQADAKRFEAEAQKFNKLAEGRQKEFEEKAVTFQAQSAAFQDRLQTIVKRAGNDQSPALIIRSSNPDPKEQSNLEEDIAVMARILDKAVEKGDDDQPRRAMGIKVFFSPGSNPMRNLYLEDYGVVFTLNVGFPLVAPAAKAEEKKEKPTEDSTWEEAKREVYGSRVEPRAGPEPIEPYSEEKVNRLKTALLEALKNAANIRGLRSDDSITVCVFGGAGAGPGTAGKSSTVRVVGPQVLKVEPQTGGATIVADEMVSDARARKFTVLTTGDSGGTPRGTTMTIRVKKSDVDAFAKGRLDLDDFRKKAGVTIYAGNAVGGSGKSVNVFGHSSGGFNY